MLTASCVLSCVLAGGDRASRVRRAVREARCSSRLYLSAFTEDLDQGAGISPFVILAQDEHERLLIDHLSRAHRGVRASTLADETEASMAIIDGMLEELEQEARTTRRVLERVPDAQLGWRPHEKARTLGQLALHVAMVPGAVAELAAKSPPIQAPSFGQDPSPGSASELVQALDVSIANARKILGGMDDAALMAKWGLMRGERELFAVPRAAFLRSIMLNHWYHHRGQLTMYLRQLGVPLPSIYGPSADENPFA